jgi:hypothetical protein
MMRGCSAKIRSRAPGFFDRGRVDIAGGALTATEYPLSSVGTEALRLGRFAEARLTVDRAPNRMLKRWSVEIRGSEILGSKLAKLIGGIHEVRVVLLKTGAICWGDAALQTFDETGHGVLVGAGDLHSLLVSVGVRCGNRLGLRSGRLDALRHAQQQVIVETPSLQRVAAPISTASIRSARRCAFAPLLV